VRSRDVQDPDGEASGSLHLPLRRVPKADELGFRNECYFPKVQASGYGASVLLCVS
jgi:hypothetical protein